MSTNLLDEPVVQPSSSPSQRLRTTFAAVRIAFTWLGTRKTLTSEQKAQAADTFGAEGQFLSAGKKLLDTTHPSFKAVTGVRSRIVSLWKALSLPYPEPGIRLIRQSQIDAFNEQLTLLQQELAEAVSKLDEHYAELKSAARERLGSLFNAADYPASLQGLFQVAWDFPAVEPPEYLRRLNPEVYQQECERVASRQVSRSSRQATASTNRPRWSTGSVAAGQSRIARAFRPRPTLNRLAPRFCGRSRSRTPSMGRLLCGKRYDDAERQLGPDPLRIRRHGTA